MKRLEKVKQTFAAPATHNKWHNTIFEQNDQRVHSFQQQQNILTTSDLFKACLPMLSFCASRSLIHVFLLLRKKNHVFMKRIVNTLILFFLLLRRSAAIERQAVADDPTIDFTILKKKAIAQVMSAESFDSAIQQINFIGCATRTDF